MNFSEKLSYAMREKKISIRELSDMTGIPKSAIQRYTSGATDKIPIDRMMLMAEALGIEPAFVMGWNDAPSIETQDADPVKAELVSIYDKLNSRGRDMLITTARGYFKDPDLLEDGASNDATA